MSSLATTRLDSNQRVTLNTDDPQHVCTTIGREYAIAAGLGFSPADLRGITRAAARASFTSATRKATLLTELDGGG
jgi:adenosine deaminase